MRYPKGYFKSKFPRTIKVKPKPNFGAKAGALLIGSRKCHTCRNHFLAFTDSVVNGVYMCYGCQEQE